MAVTKKIFMVRGGIVVVNEQTAWKDTLTPFPAELRARPMTTPRLPIRALRVFAAFALAGVVGWYSPWITASLWRVFHPQGQVTYRGLLVRVPWPWVADTDAIREDPTVTPQGLALKKMPATMNRRLAPQSLFVTVIAPDPGVTAEEQTAQWLKMFRDSHPGSEFEAATPGPIPAGASCLSADLPAKPEDVVWTCISVNGGWVATFEGRDRDEPVFFEVIGGLKR
jgi:hypothetical protein